MKCRRCKQPAVIDVRRHNAAFCADCFVHHCREQVRRAIEDHHMFGRDDRILVAVAGGKDSLGLWKLLRDLDYQADGLYVGLGIGEYSDNSASQADTSNSFRIHVFFDILDKNVFHVRPLQF